MLWQPFGQVINSNPVERFIKLANSLTVIPQQTFTCSKSTIKTFEKVVKYVQS